MAVTADTIVVALGRASYTPVEEQQWDMWIADARMLISARLGDLTLLDQAKLDYVVREAVVALVRRPDDATQVSESLDGEYSVARTYRSSKGRIVILDEWWTLLSPAVPLSGAFMIDTLGTDAAHLAWCSLLLGATYCSCGVDIAGFPIFELRLMTVARVQIAVTDFDREVVVNGEDITPLVSRVVVDSSAPPHLPVVTVQFTRPDFVFVGDGVVQVASDLDEADVIAGFLDGLDPDELEREALTGTNLGQSTGLLFVDALYRLAKGSR